MPIQLPVLPRLAQITPGLQRFGADLTPVLGGDLQRAARLGSRFQLNVTMPSLEADCARTWIAARLKAEAENDTLRLAWPEAEVGPAWGSPVVNGGGQLGTLLAVRGLTPGVQIPALRFFSILYGDGYRLHTTTEPVTAGVGGTAILAISPMLRKSANDGLGLYDPTVDVLALGTVIDWQLQLKRFTTFSFNLAEVR